MSDTTPTFDPSLVTEDPNKLVDVIVAFVDADTTEPTGGDRGLWDTDRELRALESAVVQGRQLYAQAANVFRAAAGKVKSVAALIFLMLSELNCLRRMEEDERDDDRIQVLFNLADGFIGRLDDGPRKSRLQSLWDYHAGIFASVLGMYQEAAEAHFRSAERARESGDEAGAAISAFCCAVEWVNHDLVNNPDNLSNRLTTLRFMGIALSSNLMDRTDPTAIRWSYLNMSVHMLVTHFWVGEKRDGKLDGIALRQLYTLDPELAQKEEGSTTVALAVDEFTNGSTARAWALANAVVFRKTTGQPAPEYVATAHLLLARIARKQNQAAEASRQYELAQAVNGAHQVKAIAARELVAL